MLAAAFNRAKAAVSQKSDLTVAASETKIMRSTQD